MEAVAELIARITLAIIGAARVRRALTRHEVAEANAAADEAEEAKLARLAGK